MPAQGVAGSPGDSALALRGEGTARAAEGSVEAWAALGESPERVTVPGRVRVPEGGPGHPRGWRKPDRRQARQGKGGEGPSGPSGGPGSARPRRPRGRLAAGDFREASARFPPAAAAGRRRGVTLALRFLPPHLDRGVGADFRCR